MSAQEILNALSTIIKNTFNEDNIKITELTTAEDIDEWDSLSHIELISNIENHFSIRFALGELQDLKNIGDMISLIQAKK